MVYFSSLLLSVLTPNCFFFLRPRLRAFGATSRFFFVFFVLGNSSVDKDGFLQHVRSMSETAKLNSETLPLQLERFLAEVRVVPFACRQV